MRHAKKGLSKIYLPILLLSLGEGTVPVAFAQLSPDCIMINHNLKNVICCEILPKIFYILLPDIFQLDFQQSSTPDTSFHQIFFGCQTSLIGSRVPLHLEEGNWNFWDRKVNPWKIFLVVVVYFKHHKLCSTFLAELNFTMLNER